MRRLRGTAKTMIKRRAAARQARDRRALAIIGGTTALVLLCAGLLLHAWSRLPPAIGGPFTLTDPAGQTVTRRSFPGRFLLVYFGYTHCPDVCPTTLAAIADALRRLGPLANRMQPLFVTVDPARDTPAVLARYTALFSPRIVGLTGTRTSLGATEREFHIVVDRIDEHGSAYAVDHTAALFLLDPAGRVVRVLPADGTGAALAHDLKPLLETRP